MQSKILCTGGTREARRRAPGVATLVLAAMLSACGRSEPTATVGQRIDAVVAGVERRSQALADQANDGVGRVKDAATHALDAGKRGAAIAADRLGDAAVTARVSAALLADPALGALVIDVDTRDGVVTLSGMAPTADARRRASRVAAAAEGVVRVDNRLRVGAS